MVNFARIVNGFKPLTIFATYVILDIDQGSKHASVSVFGLNLNICEFCDHRETNQFVFKTNHKDFISCFLFYDFDEIEDALRKRSKNIDVLYREV